MFSIFPALGKHWCKIPDETWKVQSPGGALGFLPLDFRTRFSTGFQGFARLLSASKWRYNRCTFCTHTESRPCDAQYAPYLVTVHLSVPNSSYLEFCTFVCQGSRRAKSVSMGTR